MTEWVLRPRNLPPVRAGTGFWLRDDVLIVNLMGRLFMRAIDCPSSDRPAPPRAPLPATSSASSTSTPKRPPKRSPWATGSTAA